MSSTVKFYPNERVDLEDMQAVSDASRDSVRFATEALFLPRDDANAGYILEGFKITQPDVEQRVLQIATGSAMLAAEDNLGLRQRGYLVLRGASEEYKTLTLEGFDAGTYGIFIRFVELEDAQETRVFWQSTTNSEFGELKKTRLVGAWDVRASEVSPGSEFLRIGSVIVGPTNTLAITDERNFFFEGRRNNPEGEFAPDWGTPEDRTSARDQNPITNLHTFASAMRRAIEDVKGTRWWLPFSSSSGGSVQSRVAFEDFYVDLVVEGFDPTITERVILIDDGVAYVNGKRLIITRTTVIMDTNQAAYVDAVHALGDVPARLNTILQSPSEPEPPVADGGVRLFVFKSNATTATLVDDRRQLDLRMRYPKGPRQRLIIGGSDTESRGELELTHLGAMTVRTDNGAAPVEFQSCDTSQRGLMQSHARGNLGSPQTVSPGDTVGGITANGYVNNGYVEMGRVQVKRDTGTGPRGRFSISLTGPQGGFEAMRIDADGRARLSDRAVPNAENSSAGLELEHRFGPEVDSPRSLSTSAEVAAGPNAKIAGAAVEVTRVGGESTEELVGLEVNTESVDGKNLAFGRGARIKYTHTAGGAASNVVGVEVGVTGSSTEGNRIQAAAGIALTQPSGDIGTYSQVVLSNVDESQQGFAVFSPDRRRSQLAGPLSADSYYNDLNLFDTQNEVAGGSKAVVIRLPRAPDGDGSDLDWAEGTYVATLRGREGVVRPMRNSGDLTPVGVLTKRSAPGDEFVEVAISGVVLALVNETIEYGAYLYATVPAFFASGSGRIVATPSPPIPLPWTTLRVRIGTALFSKTTFDEELRPVLLSPVFDLS